MPMKNPPHPGLSVEHDCLEPLGLTVTAAAKLLDVPASVRHDNTLARPLRDWAPKGRVDVIVTNPPFGGMEEDGIESSYPAEFRTRETADLFLVLLMKILKPGLRDNATRDVADRGLQPLWKDAILQIWNRR